MSQARDESVAAHKAAVESRKAIAEQKKAANRKREETLKQAKEEAKDAAKKKSDAELLSTDFLEELEEEEARTKEEERAAKKPRQNKVIKFADTKKERVERDGFVLQKVRSSSKHAMAHERISVAEEASSLLSSHFGKINRKEYSAVHSRKLGPGQLRYTRALLHAQCSHTM